MNGKSDRSTIWYNVCFLFYLKLSIVKNLDVNFHWISWYFLICPIKDGLSLTKFNTKNKFAIKEIIYKIWIINFNLIIIKLSCNYYNWFHLTYYIIGKYIFSKEIRSKFCIKFIKKKYSLTCSIKLEKQTNLNLYNKYS